MKYRVLLLGLGDWGGRWLKNISENPRCELVGIAGSESELKEVCREYGIPETVAFTDFREAISKTDAQVAVNVLPVSLHFEADRLALEKGMNIITEKPLVMSRDEADALLELKTTQFPKQKFMVSQNYRWRPHNQLIKKAIDEGMVGKVETILLEFRQREYGLDGFRGQLNYPLLEDMSIHHFDLIRFFTGSNCKKIVGQTGRPSWSQYSGRPDINAILEMENGVRVCYNGSWASRGRDTTWDGSFVITGDKGCLVMEGANEVRFYETPQTVYNGSVEAGNLLKAQSMERMEMTYTLESFLTCLEEDRIPETTLEDNIHSYRMIAACIKAIEDCRWVYL